MNVHEKALRAGWVVGPQGYYHRKSGHLVKRVTWNEAEQALARAFGLKVQEDQPSEPVPEVKISTVVVNDPSSLPALVDLPPAEQVEVEAVLNDDTPFEAVLPDDALKPVDELIDGVQASEFVEPTLPTEEELKAVLDAEVEAKASKKKKKAEDPAE